MSDLQLANPVEANYKEFLRKRDQLAGYVETIAGLVDRLGLPEEAAHGRQLKQTVERDTFKVMVIGEFKTGKSTFINALLGDEVLPSYARPCTAVIAEVKWDEEKRAVLYWQDEHKPSFEIAVEELESYVVIQDSEAEVAESPYSKVELFWPLPILHNNVEIIDSPGLNENEIREKVTLEYLRRVDAILFVFTAQRLGPSIHESEAIENLRISGHEEIFFIINRWDQLREKDRVGVREWADRKLKPLSARDQAIYYVSSLDALEGRLTRDDGRISRSGITDLEKALAEFLTRDRARVKLLRAAQELRLVIHTANNNLEHIAAMLEVPLQQLTKRYEEVNVKLRELELDLQAIVRRVSNYRSETRELVRNKTREFYYGVDTSVDQWMTEIELGFFEGLAPKSVGEKIGTFLADKLKGSADDWTKTVLSPYLDDRMQSLLRELEVRTERFEQKLDQARFDLSGYSSLAIDTTFGVEIGGPKTAVERALAAAGGWIVGGPAVAALGGAFGMREVVNSIIPQFAAIMGAVLIGLPVLPVAIVAAVVQGGIKLININETLKKAVAAEFRKKLHEYSGQHADKMVQQVDIELKRFEEALEKGLQLQVGQIRTTAETALQEKKQGEQSVEQRKREIGQIRAQITELDQQLFDFTTNLIL